MLLCLGCHAGPRAGEASEQSPAPALAPAAPTDSADSGAAHGAEQEAPASGEPIRTDLAVAGAFPLLTWAPSGKGPRALIVSAHGAGCLAEQHCEYFWRLLGGQAIVACLRGEPLFRNRPEQGFYFRDHLALARELEGAVAALQAHFAERLQEDWTFAGYSQGATMGALLLPDSPLTFAHILLIEGGGEGMSRNSAERLRDKGTRRVLFVCGTSGCRGRAERTAELLDDVGIDARVGFGQGAGHTYLGAVETTVLVEANWLWPGALDGK